MRYRHVGPLLEAYSQLNTAKPKKKVYAHEVDVAFRARDRAIEEQRRKIACQSSSTLKPRTNSAQS